MACKYKSCEMLAIFIARICCTNNTMNIEILQNTKGNPKIVCDGYMYNKSRTLKSGRISWRCERKGTKCTGAITTCSAMADPKVERPHNHDARPAAGQPRNTRLWWGSRTKQSVTKLDVNSNIIDCVWPEQLVRSCSKTWLMLTLCNTLPCHTIKHAFVILLVFNSNGAKMSYFTSIILGDDWREHCDSWWLKRQAIGMWALVRQ